MAIKEKSVVVSSPGPAEDVVRLPKTDLHVHLLGAVRSETLADLARAAGVTLPRPAAELYRHTNSAPSAEEEKHGPWYPLGQVCEIIADCISHPDHLSRLVYEALEDGLRESNVVYQELSYSPDMHRLRGMKYQDVVDGLCDGVQAAERELGVKARLIAAIGRAGTPGTASSMVQTVVEYPREEVVGIGLDGFEQAGPPESFVDAFALARRYGLYRTAHAGEHVPGGANVRSCLDELHCNRIDHGYHLLDEAALVDRCREEGIYFNAAFTTSRRAWRPWRQRSITSMVREGLNVTLNSDDPALFPTTVASEFTIGARDAGLSTNELAGIALNGFEAAFIDDSTRNSLKQSFNTALSAAPGDNATQGTSQ